MSISIPPKLSTNRKVIRYLTLVLINIMFFSVTAPLDSPALVVAGGFVLLAIDITVGCVVLLRFLSLFTPLIQRRRRRLTIASSSFFVVVMALASLGQLGWKDAVVVLVVWVIGYIYSCRVQFDRKTLA